MSVNLEEMLRTDHPENAAGASHLRLAQPLRRHVEKIRQNLQRGDSRPLPEPLGELSRMSPTESAESMSIA